MEITGTIRHVRELYPLELVVTTSTGEVTVSLEESTEITGSVSTGDYNDLRPGSGVCIVGTKSGDAGMIASRIELA